MTESKYGTKHNGMNIEEPWKKTATALRKESDGLSKVHIPVFLKEILEFLDPKPGHAFIDATANGGGHLSAIVEKIQPNGRMLGFELDLEIAEVLAKKFENNSAVIIVNQSFANMNATVKEKNFGPADGIIFDLGLSSLQLEASGRGFSFLRDEPLDMRFDSKRAELRASDIINHSTKEELERIFKEYGQERFARKIAGAIVEERKRKSIVRTGELVECIRSAIPRMARHGKIHFATRVFQALRIAVNNELETIQKGIMEAIMELKRGGRVAVISFHSLEDGIVKRIFRQEEKNGVIVQCMKKPLQPTQEEVCKNPRARSGKLRVAQKIA